MLYRLLFVLYAEARELLPLRESEPYRRAYSLEAIKRAMAETRDSDLPLLAESATLWPRLRTLFGVAPPRRPVGPAGITAAVIALRYAPGPRETSARPLCGTRAPCTGAAQ